MVMKMLDSLTERNCEPSLPTVQDISCLAPDKKMVEIKWEVNDFHLMLILQGPTCLVKI